MKLFSSSILEKDKTILFSYFRSSASWRIRIILALKQIEYEYKAINIVEKEQFTKEFLKVNPYGQVPALWIDGICLTESVSIAEYLEETRSDIFRLLPAEPKQRALVRRIVEHVNAGMQPYQNLRLLERIDLDLRGDKVEWATHWNKVGHDALEEIVKQSCGKYCVGDEITLADVFMYPHMQTGITRYGVIKDNYENLKRIFDTLGKVEEFRRGDPDKQPDSRKMKQQAAAVGAGEVDKVDK